MTELSNHVSTNGTTVGAPLSLDQARRYARHIILPEVGSVGQRKLLASKVLVIGAGGLGSPVA
ncbi:MAG TPA: ThiF family adenylyltransferase, partial [Chloroflexota bacterium]|nr:ThiF family adenylyltransferase [Chloroflexota bacterium]